MKKISFKKVSLLALILVVPTVGYAATGQLNPVDMVSEMQRILDQYKSRIQALEAENQMLREIMVKHEIQIPLDEYQRSMRLTGSLVSTPVASSPPAPQVAPATIEGRLALLTPFQRGFVEQIAKDWPNIRTAYGLPADSRIAGFEFVKNEAGNNVFADIVSGTGTEAGAYNYKLLYEVNTADYSRKLRGLFEFSDAQKAYITRRGNNPFPSAERQFILNPYGAYFVAPNTGTPASQTGSTNSGSTTVPPPATSTPPTPSNVSKELSDAYQAAQYAKVLEISDNYLKSNAPTFEVLRYRYRVHFINKHYSEALAEIKKMQDLGLATDIIYCDAYVIALYAGNQTLANQYKTQAGASCKGI